MLTVSLTFVVREDTEIEPTTYAENIGVDA